MLFHRQKLLDLLYRRLPKKENRIYTTKKVISIDSHTHGVRVGCDDGSIEEGSIAVGCDGAHSSVRSIMRDLAFKSSAKVIDNETPMVAHYQLLVGYMCRIPHLEAQQVWEIRNNGLSMQIFISEDEGWFLIYRRLSKPAYWHTRYTEKDVQNFATELMDYPTIQGLRFRDLWEARQWVRLVNIEEGIAKRWHYDRIVLVGDSAHKMTPNAGLSLNQGWQGVVALANILRQLILTTPSPDTASLATALGTYQTKTEKMAKDCLRLSALHTRVTAWHNIAYRLADYLGPYFGGDSLLIRMFASPIITQGLILDFLPEPGYKAGRLKWTNKVAEEDVPYNSS